MIAVGVLVAIIAAVAIYYFFFTETEKEKDAKEFVNKLKILKEEKKTF
jgi:flagellar basal body-associated protein FliL